MTSQDKHLSLHEKHRQQLDSRKASAAMVLRVLHEHFPFSSVLDVGCGVGAWLAAARDLGANHLHGIDGPWVDTSLLAFESQDFEARDLNQPFDLGRSFDLIISIEVGEHIKPASSEALVESITRHGDVVVFSAALPGQGGAGHINEQWPEFWVKLFRKFGFEAYDLIRRTAWGNESIPPWVQQNSFLFIRNSVCVPASLTPYRIAGLPVTMVHRTTYSRLLRRLAEQEKAQTKEAEKTDEAGLPAPALVRPASGAPAPLHEAAPAKVAEVLQTALEAGTPCSMIRLSHCEAKFLAWPNGINRRDINRSLKRQFGFTDLTDEDVNAIAAEICAAVACSDILGIPLLTPRQFKEAEEGHEGYRLWSLVAPACERKHLLRSDAIVASPNIHIRLMEDKFLERMLGVTREVTLVGCRDLRAEFRSLGFTEVHHIAVPEAARTRPTGIEVPRHYPTAFQEIVARIRREARRGLFFVGAGFLGKVYCREIRLAGGVAVDIGSVMDVWAGVASRTGYDEVVKQFALQGAEA